MDAPGNGRMDGEDSDSGRRGRCWRSEGEESRSRSFVARVVRVGSRLPRRLAPGRHILAEIGNHPSSQIRRVRAYEI